MRCAGGGGWAQRLDGGHERRFGEEVSGEVRVQLGERVAVERLQIQLTDQPVAVRRAERAWIGAKVELGQRRKRAQDVDRRVERRELISEERERREPHAPAEGRDRADLVVGGEELAELDALRERAEVADAVEVDVDYLQLKHRGARRERADGVI